jgi:hypothetical protein
MNVSRRWCVVTLAILACTGTEPCMVTVPGEPSSCKGCGRVDTQDVTVVLLPATAG